MLKIIQLILWKECMINKNIFFLGLLLLVPTIVNAAQKDELVADTNKSLTIDLNTIKNFQQNPTTAAAEKDYTFSLKNHIIRPAIWGATIFSAYNALDGNKKCWAAALTLSALNSAFELKSWQKKPKLEELKKLARDTILNTALTTIGVWGFKELRQNSYNLLTADVSRMDIPKLTTVCVSLLAIKPCYNQFLNPLIKTMWNTPVNKLKFSLDLQ